MLRSLALYALWATSALAAVPAVKETFVRCGTDNPSPELQAAANAMGSRPVPLAAQTLNVRTYFHVVTTRAAQGSITQSQLNDQLAVLNRSYGPSGISFTLISSDFTTNDQWATGNYDSTMKPALRKGTYADLNVYFLSDLGGGLLGICNFPTNASPGSSTYNQDGCDVLAQSVPGGTTTNYNQGGSATHEIGHWFGLFHVFQGRRAVGAGIAKVGDTVNSMEATVNMIDSGIDALEGNVETIQHQLDEHFDITTTNTSLQFHSTSKHYTEPPLRTGVGENLPFGDFWALEEHRNFFKLLSLLIAYGIDGSRWKERGDQRLIQEHMIDPERMSDIRKALMLHPDKAHRALALELERDYDRIAATFAQYEDMPPIRVKEEYSVPRQSVYIYASGAPQRTQPSVKREIKCSLSHQDPNPQPIDSPQEARRTRARHQPPMSPSRQTGFNKKRKREEPARN
ncbi:MAG: hypothetical protein L6R37_006952 [Teloschistes peruensis]|nr:MAG: hypothetical protein L6R37_006952 [Teloschistes peruensis]